MNQATIESAKFDKAGLIAQYKLNGNALDSSGNEYDGSIAGNVTFDTGLVGQCAVFDASSSTTINLPADFDTLLDSSHDWTVCYWVRVAPDSDLQYNMFFFYRGTQAVGPSQGFDMDTDSFSKSRFRYDTTTEQNKSLNGSVINDGNWHHCALTHTTTTSTFTLYTDGVSNGTLVYTGTFSVIGGSSIARKIHYTAFACDMDDVRIYNRILSQSEIDELYNEGNGTEQQLQNYSYPPDSEVSKPSFQSSISTNEISVAIARSD